MKLLYTVQNNVMYKYTFYHALYSVRVSISYYVLHVAMLVLLIDYSSKYKSYASEPSLYSGTATHACFGSTFPAAGCECIHLQSACSLYRYSADIRTLHGHGCTCNGAKQIKMKCPCRCNHAIHMVLFFERNS